MPQDMLQPLFKPMPMNKQQAFKSLAVALLATAKDTLDEDGFNTIDIKKLTNAIPLFAESVPFEHLMQKPFLLHIVHGLKDDWTQQQLLMHVFLLSIFRRYDEGSKHPLEKGVLRQKILSLLPLFEKAMQEGCIPVEDYDKNADALAHFADESAEIQALSEALRAELHRYD